MAHQPKAYKKFVASAATATLVATAIVPVASAATDFKDVSKTYEKEVNYLVENGIAKGTTETTFGTNSNISRGDAAVMIANALKLDTTSAPDAGFQDVNARVAGAVNAIVEAKIASGKTATAFAPADYITRQEMAKMLANAYKLTAKENANFKDVNSNWIGYVSALKEAGITLGKTDTTFAPTDNLTRGEFALFIYRAEVELVPAPPATPEVVSVSATNLVEVVVELTSELTGTEAANVANYSVNGDTPLKVTVNEKNVTLLLAEADKLVNYSKNNELKIAAKAGLAKDFETKFAVSDTAIPASQSAKGVGPRLIEVTFSEPLDETVSKLDTVRSFQLDGGQVALDTTYAVYSGNTVTLKTLSDISEGEHKLTIRSGANNALQDYAGYKVAPRDIEFSFVIDKTPVSADLVANTETTATIKFNKKIDAASLIGNGNALFTHTRNSSLNQVTGANVTNPTGDGQTFVVDFGASKPFPPGSTTMYFKYADEKAQLVKDNWGNEFAETTFTIATSVDNVKPTVSSVTFVDSTKIEVAFSEAVLDSAATNGARNTANYTLKDANGDKIAVTGAAFKAGTNNVIVLTTDTINGGNHTLEVKEVKDRSVAGNKLETVTVTFAAKDEVKPSVVSASRIATDKVRVNFSEAMDVDSILSKSNYQLNGAALSKDDTITAINGNKAVVITFKTAPTAGGTINVGRVKDAAGNFTSAFVTPVTFLSTVAAITADEAQVTGSKQVKVIIEDEVVSGATHEDFEVSIDNGTSWFAPTRVSSSVVEGGDTVITITLPDGKEITNTAVAAGNSVQVRTVSSAGVQGATKGAQNEFGTALDFTETAIDKLAPKLVAANAKDNDSNNHVDRFVVTFSEALYAPSVSDEDFSVAGYEVQSIAHTGTGEVTVFVKELDVNDLSVAPTVTLVGDVEDARRNVLKKGSEVKAQSVAAQGAVADQAAADAVIAQINSASSQSQVEAARTAYNGLTTAQKALVTNEATLQTKEQGLVDAQATAVGTTFAPAAAAAGTTALPSVPSGYSIAVKSTSAPAIYDTDGKLVADGTSNVVYTVTHTASGKTKDTATVAVTVDVTP
ncbi:S-layer homology domain-containing protein [Saccharococcus sp. Marseille-Q5394]|uniref:S-layer homology domain-containing protein n=1 Tax=Saccharococcus sp. Marseille-Q5394 TaxID=2972778 RepID=UPI0021C68D2E|nr:S-layer homology domain-containing protein [Saccharococcus sp. Marseille-Q5394]